MGYEKNIEDFLKKNYTRMVKKRKKKYSTNDIEEEEQSLRNWGCPVSQRKFLLTPMASSSYQPFKTQLNIHKHMNEEWVV